MNVYAVVLESASRDAKKKNVSAGSPSETLVTGEKLAICHWSCKTGGSKDGIVIGKNVVKIMSCLPVQEMESASFEKRG